MNVKRMPSVRRLGLGLMLGSGLCTLGCVSGAALRGRVSGVGDRIEVANKPGHKCAPKALARAEAHLEFARLELDQGGYYEARNHLLIATNETVVIEAAARRPECQENLDRDGDGILDQVDLCPDAPEDFDGFEDKDGCPEDQDTDGDGIVDSKDQCPNDPEDFDGDADEDGCPDIVNDADKDGIPDDKDKCPQQPEDKDTFEDRDGCPDPDNDQDGIFDIADKCPLQAEDKDNFEDEDGCPDPDNDKDRIPDLTDKCPNQPEDYDGDEDTDGCPDIYKTIVVKGDRIELKQSIFFATGKDRILKRSNPMLDEVALALTDNPDVQVRIEGHTDSKGSTRSNQRLSKRRANAVRRYLIGQGLPASRLKAVGLGEDSPIEDNRTSSGRAANRRVEFHLIKN